YEPNTCKVLRQFFETTVTLEEIVDGQLPVIRCSFIYSLNLNQYQTDDWFRGGIVETGFGLQYEIRSVLGSKWNGTELELTLNAPLIFAQPGANLQLVTGCDHTVTACLTKFNNFDNFGAFVAVPDQNLSLKGLNASVAQGNKK
ncbi:MAG TPA: phage BR0599 family protein, partial [Verrucomicrobiae bacterium]|nr:phage BR0599 family protein [Verrucomicrobiae bacterium]